MPALRETTASLAASLHAVSQAVVTQGTGTSNRFQSSMVVMQDTIRPSTPHTTAMTASGQLQASNTEGKTKTKPNLYNL